MKSSENFIEAIRNYLDSRAESDNLFAIRYADPSKSVEECCQFILNEVKRQGVAVMTNDEVFSLATHYFDGDCTAEEIGKPINCKVVISKDQLTEEDKAELKQQAMEQREKERQQAIEDRARFEELKSRYFGLAMNDGEIEIHSIDSIDDYYKIGEKTISVAVQPSIFSKKRR